MLRNIELILIKLQVDKAIEFTLNLKKIKTYKTFDELAFIKEWYSKVYQAKICFK